MELDPVIDENVFEVLLIEDNEGDAYLTRKAFEMADMRSRIQVAEDGEQAMEILQRKGEYRNAAVPDLILLDMNLPRQTGLDILKSIKSDVRFCKIPVIVLSSSRAESDVQSSYAMHGNGYILKPHGIRRLSEVVKAIETFWFKTAILPHG